MEELNKKSTSIDQIVSEKLNIEKSKMKTDLERKLRGDISTELDALRKELEENKRS